MLLTNAKPEMIILQRTFRLCINQLTGSIEFFLPAFRGVDASKFCASIKISASPDSMKIFGEPGRRLLERE